MLLRTCCALRYFYNFGRWVEYIFFIAGHYRALMQNLARTTLLKIF
jgi:hypothetical protein